MIFPRTRLLIRGIVAVSFALLLAGLAGEAIAESRTARAGDAIALVITLIVGAFAFAVLAWAAFALHQAVAGATVDVAALGRARQSYRLCVLAVPLIAVAGLGAGAVTALAYGRPANFGLALWFVGLTLLAYLLTLRGQGKSVARVTWLSEHPGEMG